MRLKVAGSLTRHFLCVDRVDVAPEMENRGEWAALASAASSADCSVSRATPYLSTLYSLQTQDGPQEMERN